MHKIQWKPLLISLAIPLAVGGVSALLTNNAMEHFRTLNKPWFAPPEWLFPVVWTILFFLMGISCYLVVTSAAPESQKKTALTVYGAQLFFNFFWTLIFFTFSAYLAAFIWLIVLWIMILAMIVLFSRIRKPAGLLQIPYLLWVTFAGILNFSIYSLNP